MTSTGTGRGPRQQVGTGPTAGPGNLVAPIRTTRTEAGVGSTTGMEPRTGLVTGPEDEVFDFPTGPELAIGDGNPDHSPEGSSLDAEDPAAERQDEEQQARPRYQVPVAITFTYLPERQGKKRPIEWEVQHRGRTGVPYDDYTRALAVADLDRLAGAIASMQPRAVRAESLVEAFRALENVTGTQLGKRVGRDGTYISRWQHIVVEIGSGLVPLEFFTWKNWDEKVLVDREGKPTEEPSPSPKQLMTGWLLRYWNAICDPGSAPEPAALEKSIAGKKSDTLYQYRDLLFSLKQHWALVEDHKRRWPMVGRDSLVDSLRSVDPASWEEWVTRVDQKTRERKRVLGATAGSTRIATLALSGLLTPPIAVGAGAAR
ncbi:hypothetical protein SAMN05892883_2805 [Jatrophihabitans sp. GAS493]|uniref:hypothetical protein n=1 Tax=Jatrophihabitans sp. GAS493 TaxID=1907575 RepID=UPI000BC03870|nr:hypothetical protein [Jatrophihabitans sp. GAS493]SOD73513.1 hypothetical protein SAMN05892883_2805 [Jatrophihabitans sp. GAS493]